MAACSDVFVLIQQIHGHEIGQEHLPGSNPHYLRSNLVLLIASSRMTELLLEVTRLFLAHYLPTVKVCIHVN